MSEAASAVWTVEIDLRGEVCPYTFVKTKLALEGMASGEVMRVLLDFPESVNSVPRSARNEGHEVIEIGRLEGDDWQVLIRKK